jgi:hypothetical protein
VADPVEARVFRDRSAWVTMEGMSYTAGTTGSLRSDLLDLSAVALDELREVNGLRDALDALRDRLAEAPAPLCESTMAAFCGTAPRVPPGGRP